MSKCYVYVQFDGTPHKQYCYKVDTSRVTLIIGRRYDIIADGRHQYDNAVTIIGFTDSTRINPIILRTITKATLVNNPRPNDGIKNVYFNEEKGTTVIHWKDDVRTKVTLQEGDVFDKEKAIALCYMKRYMMNRGAYNEVFKKWIKEGTYQ